MSELKLVFLAPVEQGHSNVHRAICSHLLSTNLPEVASLSIHVIGDEPARSQWHHLIQESDTSSLVFHAMGTHNHLEIGNNGERIQDHTNFLKSKPASLAVGGLELCERISSLIYKSPTEYLTRYQAIRRVISEVKPDMVILDILFRNMGRDACNTEGYKYIVLSPGTSIDHAALHQPRGAGLWKFPPLFTNITYPVPWYLIPYNIILSIAIIYRIVSSGSRKSLEAARKEAGVPGSLLATSDKGAEAFLLASMAEMEYPHLPMTKTVYCGPIIRHVPPISPIEYPEIHRFLDQKRTVVLNLGTLFTYNDRDVKAIVSAMGAARRSIKGGFQLLWKLPHASNFSSIIEDGFGSEKDREETLVREWLDPPALAILQHPNVACLISHAGANSLIEAAYVGLPQIHLAFWFDLFTLAARSEWAGIGIYANKGKEPEIDHTMLKNAIVKVLDDSPGSEGACMRQKAGDLAKKVRATDGTRTASDVILKAAMSRYSEILFYEPCLPAK